MKLFIFINFYVKNPIIYLPCFPPNFDDISDYLNAWLHFQTLAHCCIRTY